MGFAEMFKALSDLARQEILLMLRGGRLSAGEITSQFDIAAASVSYHLSQLKKAGLIRESKHKNFVYYDLNASVFEELMLWFSQFKGGEENG